MPTSSTRKPATPRKRAATKRTAAPRSNGTDTPQHGLDLDALEYDGPAGAYPFRLGGRWFELKSAAELDVHILGDLQRDPMLFFAQAMSSDDHAAFLELSLPAFKLRKLLDAYADHYELGN